MPKFAVPRPPAVSSQARVGFFVFVLVILSSGVLSSGILGANSVTPAAVKPAAAKVLTATDAGHEVGSGGARHFCMAPPVPQRNLPAPYPEFAPRMRDYREAARRHASPFGVADTARILFILAEFADVPFDTAGVDTTGIYASAIEYNPDTIIHEFFKKQLEFVRQYYADVSYGKHVFVPVVLDEIVRLPLPMAYYGDDDKFGERGTRMIWDAVVGADEAVEFGGFDGVSIIHSAAGQESDVSNNSKDLIWSAFFPEALISVVLTDSLGYNVPGIPTNDFTAEGDTVYVAAAAILPETEMQDGFNFGLMGVYAHELGHVMVGWPDLYDTVGESQGVGSYCLMASGTWNANGNVPGEPSAWCRMYAGWTEPRLIDPTPGAGETVTLTALETDNPDPDDVLLARIPISGDEYFLVANLNPDPNDNESFDWGAVNPDDPSVNFWADSYVGAEFDFFLPNEVPGNPVGTYKEPAGLTIWHVDESVVTFAFPFNRVNGDAHHHGIDLEEADGVQDLEFPAFTLLSFGGPDDLFRAGEADRFTPDTDPNTAPTFGGPASVSILDIGAPGDEVSFRVERSGGDGTPGSPAIHALYPQTYPSPISANPLVVNLDSSPEYEAVVIDDEGWVRVRSFAPGSPTWTSFNLGAAPLGTPSFGPASSASSDDIVVATVTGDVMAIRTSNPLTLRESVFVDSLLTGEGVLIDLDDDGVSEFVIGAADAPNDSTAVPGRLHVVSLSDGTVRTIPVDQSPAGPIVGLGGGVVAVPLAFGGLATIDLSDGVASSLEIVSADVQFGPPAAGDLDRDGAIDVVSLGDDGRLYAFELIGSLVERWTAAVGGVPGSGVSLADLDNDGYLEALSLGTSGSLHAFNYNGVSKPGWPVYQDVAQDVFFDFTVPSPAPLAADIDGDGAVELMPVFADGRVDVFDVTETTVRKMKSLVFQGGPGSVPVVGDFDDDGKGELFLLESVADQFGSSLWNRATTWNLGSPYIDRADAWTMYRGHPSGNATSSGSPRAVPEQSELLVNVYCQPNPAGPEGAWIHYRLDNRAETVGVAIYDVAGQEVRTLPGTGFGGVDNLVHWDGRNTSGDAASPGLYVYRVTAKGGGKSQAVVGKMALVR